MNRHNIDFKDDLSRQLGFKFKARQIWLGSSLTENKQEIKRKVNNFNDLYKIVLVKNFD